MDYKKCWIKLIIKLSDIKAQSVKEENGWINIITADTLLELMTKIEREVQDEEQR